MTYAKPATGHSQSTELLSQGVTQPAYCPLMAVAGGYLSEVSSRDRSHQNPLRAGVVTSLWP